MWQFKVCLKSCGNSYMIHLQEEQCTRTYQNQHIIQPDFVVTVGVRTKSVLKFRVAD